MFPHLHAALSGFIADYGTGAVILVIFLESLGLPVPGELMLITGAALVARGEANPVLFFAGAWAAAVIGDNLGYLVGRKLGAKAIVRYGTRFGVTEARYEWAAEKFRRVGPVIIAGARFVAVLRQVNGIVAGSLKMPWPAFALFNAVGAALWVGLWGTLTLTLGRHIERIVALAHHPAVIFTAAAVIVGVAALLWRLGGGRRKTPAV